MREHLWHWQGLNANGEKLNGAIWASHRPAVLIELQQQRITVVALKRRSINSSLWRTQHSCMVISQLATLLQAGLTLSDSLTLLAFDMYVENREILAESRITEIRNQHAQLARWAQQLESGNVPGGNDR